LFCASAVPRAPSVRAEITVRAILRFLIAASPGKGPLSLLSRLIGQAYGRAAERKLNGFEGKVRNFNRPVRGFRVE
jgi:hypothetical protein